jgi:flagellar biosynthesis protein FliR
VQVYFLGLPAKIALGLMTLSLTLAILMPQLIDTLRAIGPRMLRLLGS